MKYIKLLIVSIFLILIGACDFTKEIDYERYYNPQIVVNASISWEDGVDAIIKKTLPPYNLDTTDTIASARVWLCHRNEVLYELTKINDHEYMLGDTVKLRTDWGYYLKVDARGVGIVTTDTLYKGDKMDFDSVGYVFNKKGEPAFVRYYLSDTNARTNYYNVRALTYKNGEKEFDAFGKTIYPLDIHSDEEFTDSVYTGDYQLGRSEFDSVEVILYSVSKSLFDFGKSYDDYSVSYGDHYYEDIYSILSNINNGVGIFFSYEKTTRCLKYQNN